MASGRTEVPRPRFCKERQAPENPAKRLSPSRWEGGTTSEEDVKDVRRSAKQDATVGRSAKKMRSTIGSPMAMELRSSLDITRYTVATGTPGRESDAYDIFQEEGFVLVRDVLGYDACDSVYDACEEAASLIVSRSGKGNRPPHGRYPSAFCLFFGAFYE